VTDELRAAGTTVLQRAGDTINAGSLSPAATTSAMIRTLQTLGNVHLAPILFEWLSFATRETVGNTSKGQPNWLRTLISSRGWSAAVWSADEVDIIRDWFDKNPQGDDAKDDAKAIAEHKSLHSYVERIKKLRIDGLLTPRLAQAMAPRMRDLSMYDPGLVGITAITTSKWPALQRLELRGTNILPALNLGREVGGFFGQFPTGLRALRLETLAHPISPSQFTDWFKPNNRQWWSEMQELGLPVIMKTDAQWVALAKSCPNLTMLVITGGVCDWKQPDAGPDRTLAVTGVTFALIQHGWPALEDFRCSWHTKVAPGGADFYTLDWQVVTADWRHLTEGCPKLRRLEMDLGGRFTPVFNVQTDNRLATILASWKEMRHLDLDLNLPMTRTFLNALNTNCRHLEFARRSRNELHEVDWRAKPDDFVAYARAHKQLTRMPPSTDWSDGLLHAIAENCAELEVLDTVKNRSVFVTDERDLAPAITHCRRVQTIEVQVRRVTDALFEALRQRPPDPIPRHWSQPMRPLTSILLTVHNVCTITTHSLHAIIETCRHLQHLRLQPPSGLEDDRTVALQGTLRIGIRDIQDMLTECPHLEQLDLFGGQYNLFRPSQKEQELVPLHDPVNPVHLDALGRMTRPFKRTRVHFSFPSWTNPDSPLATQFMTSDNRTRGRRVGKLIWAVLDLAPYSTD
jgi:hypothetical protein